MLDALKRKLQDAVDPDTSRPYAIVGYFETPADLYHACEELRDAGYRRFDAHTPFPVHGLEQAMGLRPSIMPWLVLVGGTLGLVGAIALAYYTQEVFYAHVIGGKRAFSWQAYVPIFFECTILLAALTAFVGVWGLNKLPQYFHPVMQHPSFHRSTDDAFFISVECADPGYGEGTRALLERLGAKEIEEVTP